MLRRTLKSVATRLGASARLNLVLVFHDDMAADDFRTIAAHVNARTDTVYAIAWDRKALGQLPAPLPHKKTVVVCPVSLRKDPAVEGQYFSGRWLSKSQEYEALERAGIAVPSWRLLTAEATPELSPLDPYVIVKPDGGGRGAEVRIQRKERVRYRPWASNVGVQGGGWIVQNCIYAGRRPFNYRVGTFFGRALYAWKVEMKSEVQPLPEPDAKGRLKDYDGTPFIPAIRGKGRYTLDVPEDVVAFAEGAHAAFPNVPLLGIDVVREECSGRLFVLEVNASGWVWHFSSKVGTGIQQDHGIDLARDTAMIKAATVLVERFAPGARPLASGLGRHQAR